MELRVHGDIEAAETPTGLIPLYDDLAKLFQQHLGKEYPEERYEKEFALRVQKHLEKIERIWRLFQQIPVMPKEAFEQLRMQKERLKQARDKWRDPIPPYKFYKR